MPKYVTVLVGLMFSCRTVRSSLAGFRRVRDRFLGGRKIIVCVLREFIVSPHLLHHELKMLIASFMVLLMCCIVLLSARKAVSSAY